MSDSIQEIEQRLKAKYPIFANIEVTDKRESGVAGQRKLEFYHPEDSPTGKPLIEVFDQSMQGVELENAILGDMLHNAPYVNENFAKLRNKLKQTRTPEQILVDKQAYEIAKTKHGEQRSFDKWMEYSRLDAFVRGYAVKQWNENYYTNEQKLMIDTMMDELKPEGSARSMMSK